MAAAARAIRPGHDGRNEVRPAQPIGGAGKGLVLPVQPSRRFSTVEVKPKSGRAAWDGGRLHRPMAVEPEYGAPFGRARGRGRHDLRLPTWSGMPPRPGGRRAPGTIIGRRTVSNRGPGRRGEGPIMPAAGILPACASCAGPRHTVRSCRQTSFPPLATPCGIEMKERAGPFNLRCHRKQVVKSVDATGSMRMQSLRLAGKWPRRRSRSQLGEGLSAFTAEGDPKQG